MKLEDYRKAKHEDFFLAVIAKTISWDAAREVVVYLPEYPKGITVTRLLEIAVEQALAENNEPVTEENKKHVEEEVKQLISTQLESWAPVILLKRGEGYIDISEMIALAPEYEIRCLVPFKEYYNENDYSFEEDEDGEPYLEIDSGHFNDFVDDYERGKFN